MKDNKLIAEFMGFVYVPEDALDYSKSWDWLMPVVQKCFEVAENEDDFFDISGNLPYMDETYKSVVNFIKTYNDEAPTNEPLLYSYLNKPT
jgi:hypothetical protein